MNIEKLPRAPMRREDEPGYEKEIWRQPTWDCFCCHDTGIIALHLAAKAIDGYNPNRDKLPRCVNPGCKQGSYWDSGVLSLCVDYRISAATCQKLDAAERADWRQTTLTQVKQIQNRINDTATHLSLRRRDGREANRLRHRTLNEEVEVQQRHQEVCNADPQKLREMAQAYLGDEYMRNGSS